jgi:hypothetical protein
MKFSTFILLGVFVSVVSASLARGNELKSIGLSEPLSLWVLEINFPAFSETRMRLARNVTSVTR